MPKNETLRIYLNEEQWKYSTVEEVLKDEGLCERKKFIICSGLSGYSGKVKPVTCIYFKGENE